MSQAAFKAQVTDQQEQQETMNIYQKLMQARLRLQGAKLEKTGHNKFAGYKYFELGDFIPRIQEIFSELGLCGIVSYGKEQATLVIVDSETELTTHEDGHHLVPSIVIESPMSSAALKGCHEVQNLGAVETYIRRYLWVTALEICEHDALDATAGKETSGKGQIKPSDGVEARVPAASKEALERLFSSIVDYLESDTPDEAVKAFDSLTDPDERVLVWDRLDSKARSWMKRRKQEMALEATNAAGAKNG